MKKKKKTLSDQLKAGIKTMKKKTIRKLLVTVVLPGAAAALGTAAVKTFLRVKLRQIAAKAEPADENDSESGTAQGETELAEGNDSESGTAQGETEPAAPQGASDSSAVQNGTDPAAPRGASDSGRTKSAPRREPVVLETSRPEFITPEPVETTICR